MFLLFNLVSDKLNWTNPPKTNKQTNNKTATVDAFKPPISPPHFYDGMPSITRPTIMLLVKWWWWWEEEDDNHHHIVVCLLSGRHQPAVCRFCPLLLPLSCCFDKSRHWQVSLWRSFIARLNLTFTLDPQSRFVLLISKDTFHFRLRPNQRRFFFFFGVSVNFTNIEASKPKLSTNILTSYFLLID